MILRYVVLLALALPASAHAYTRTAVPDQKGRPIEGTCLYWQGRQIPWSPARTLGGELAEEVALEAMRQSFQEWERHSCSDLKFVERAPSARETGYSDRGGNSNVVLFRDVACADVVPRGAACLGEGGCADEYDCWDFGDNIIAVTTTTFSQCTGRIVDADIEFNAAAFHFTTGSGGPCGAGGGRNCVDTDLRNTLVHEIGHLIGFDHSSEGDAAMFKSAEPGETKKRALHDDDIAALCDVYPRGDATWICDPARPPSQCGESRGAQASSSNCTSGGGGLALLSLVPTLSWGWRRRRR